MAGKVGTFGYSVKEEAAEIGEGQRWRESQVAREVKDVGKARDVREVEDVRKARDVREIKDVGKGRERETVGSAEP